MIPPYMRTTIPVATRDFAKQAALVHMIKNT